MSKTGMPPRDLYTNLAGAILASANLKDVIGTSSGQLAQAKSLAGTILPDGSTHA